MIDIYPWATDTAGCFYQRLKLPLDALVRAYPDEFNVCWNCDPHPGDGNARAVVLGQRIMGNGDAPDVQWLSYCEHPGFFAVYEIDDDILDLDPGNAVPYSIFTPNRAGTVRNIVAADYVICATRGLERKLTDRVTEYQTGEHVSVAPNCVADGSVIERNGSLPTDRPIVVGWAGSMFHQQDFPRETVAQLAAVRDQHPDVAWISVGANYLGWGSSFGWSDIASYHSRLSLFDIGFAPIQRTPFNASKSWIKGLDYMAAGVVPVLEHWGQYPELIGTDELRDDVVLNYIGLTTEHHGFDVYLSKAIVDFKAGFFEHNAIAERARQYEISNHIHRWADVFRKAAQ